MERRANDERLAILEVELASLKENSGTIMKKLDCLIAENHKARGFWAGVIAAGTALGGILGFLISYILKYRSGS